MQGGAAGLKLEGTLSLGCAEKIGHPPRHAAPCCATARFASHRQHSSLHRLPALGFQIEDLKQFRQWGSKCPGHPENFLTEGVEVRGTCRARPTEPPPQKRRAVSCTSAAIGPVSIALCTYSTTAASAQHAARTGAHHCHPLCPACR